MKIALASAPVRDGDTAYNLTQMAQFIWQAKEQRADLVCFGEAYLQGFDALSWKFEADRTTAASVHSPVFQIIAGWTKDTGVDVLFGFLEREGEAIYSACALVAGGVLTHCSRRLSGDWISEKADDHYRTGAALMAFDYGGKQCSVALGSDLRNFQAKFRGKQDCLFWLANMQWDVDCIRLADEVSGQVFLINPLADGCSWITDGVVRKSQSAGLLLAEI